VTYPGVSWVGRASAYFAPRWWNKRTSFYHQCFLSFVLLFQRQWFRKQRKLELWIFQGISCLHSLSVSLHRVFAESRREKFPDEPDPDTLGWTRGGSLQIADDTRRWWRRWRESARECFAKCSRRHLPVSKQAVPHVGQVCWILIGLRQSRGSLAWAVVKRIIT